MYTHQHTYLFHHHLTEREEVPYISCTLIKTTDPITFQIHYSLT
jgi:hypothetical protein